MNHYSVSLESVFVLRRGALDTKSFVVAVDNKGDGYSGSKGGGLKRSKGSRIGENNSVGERPRHGLN